MERFIALMTKRSYVRGATTHIAIMWPDRFGDAKLNRVGAALICRRSFEFAAHFKQQSVDSFSEPL